CLGLWNAKAVEFRIPVALAHAEIEATVGQKIERRRLLGKQHRIVPRQYYDRGAKPQALRTAGNEAQEVERGRNLAVAGEMVLDHEQACIAEFLGVEHVIDELVIGLAVGARLAARLAPAEKTELHRHLRCANFMPLSHGRADASTVGAP